MPSVALGRWRTDQAMRLDALDAQCAASSAPGALPSLADDNLRGFTMHLSGNFQEFCRDLHTECVLAVVAAVSLPLRVVVQTMGLANRELDAANPRYETLCKDFGRFGLNLNVALRANPANAARIAHIDHLNLWRNYAAHRKSTTPTVGGPFDLTTARSWRTSCAEFATELDGILYNSLRGSTGLPPW